MRKMTSNTKLALIGGIGIGYLLFVLIAWRMRSQKKAAAAGLGGLIRPLMPAQARAVRATPVFAVPFSVPQPKSLTPLPPRAVRAPAARAVPMQSSYTTRDD